MGIAVSDVVAIASPATAASAALGGAWLGGRGAFKAQRETADRHDAREDRARLVQLRGAARLIHSELTVNLVRMTTAKERGVQLQRAMVTAVWGEQQATLALADDPEIWSSVASAYLALPRVPVGGGEYVRPCLSDGETRELQLCIDTVWHATETLAALCGRRPMGEIPGVRC
jgi:hypothetical protein